MRLDKPGGITAVVPNALTVVLTGAPNLETNLVLPPVLGRHGIATIWVEYANTGTVAMPAPLIQLRSTDPDGSDKPLLTLKQQN